MDSFWVSFHLSSQRRTILLNSHVTILSIILSTFASYYNHRVFWWLIQIFSKVLSISQFVSNFRTRFWHHRFIVIASCIQPGPIPKLAIKLYNEKIKQDSCRKCVVRLLICAAKANLQPHWLRIETALFMGFQKPTERKASNVGCRDKQIMLINKVTKD